jgi:hypothetical protein
MALITVASDAPLLRGAASREMTTASEGLA